MSNEDATRVDPAQSRRKAQVWASVAILGSAVAVILMAVLYVGNARQDADLADLQQDNQVRDQVIASQDQVIRQVCEVAGGQVDTAPTAARACARVQQNLPAVETPTPAASVVERPVSIRSVYQVDTCAIAVELTNGTTSRLGPLCGAPGASGAPGPSGPPGPTGLKGPDGDHGAAGTGIADVRLSADKCFVEVHFTDDSVKSVGPFCAPPADRIVIKLDGSARDCPREGDSLPPTYSCSEPPTTSTQQTSPTDASPTPTPPPPPAKTKR